MKRQQASKQKVDLSIFSKQHETYFKKKLFAFFQGGN